MRVIDFLRYSLLKWKINRLFRYATAVRMKRQGFANVNCILRGDEHE